MLIVCFQYSRIRKDLDTWTWSLTFREERRLRLFENRVLRRMFGPKRDEVRDRGVDKITWWGNDLYSTPSIIRVIKSKIIRWAEHVARMRERRVIYRVLVGKPEEKRPLGRPRRKWEDNIRMDLQEVGLRGMNWIDLAQNRYKWRALQMR